MKSQEYYYRAPVWLQNILVSVYGYYLRHKRYGGDYAEVYERVQQFKELSPSAVEQYQTDRFLSMVRYCYERVPYYRELFRNHKLTPNDFKSLEDLPKIPILDKQTVRTHRDVLQTEGAKPYWKQHTSGSTGTPLTILLDRFTYQLSMALLADHEATYGLRPEDVRATFAGRMVQPIENQRPPFWRYNPTEHQMLFSSYHLSDETMPHYLEKLEKLQPREIIGYPSAIYTVAEYCLRHSITHRISPVVVITNSETLFEWQRDTIEKAFNCPVADYYGSAECVVFAGQCKAGNYHFNPLLNVVEILKDEGVPAEPGEQGRLVCTSLTNFVMPLLRYEIGDDAVAMAPDCRCGLHYPGASAIVGRTDDNVITPDGRVIGRLDHIFKGLHGVRECQIVQESIHRITLKVIPSETFDETQRAALIKNLKERVGTGFDIRIEEVSHIPRTSRGKFKGVVNRMQGSVVVFRPSRPIPK